MCEYCRNTDTGNELKSLGELSVNFGLLGKGIADASIIHNNGNPCLSLSLLVEDTESSTTSYNEQKILISYCPMCGRKLR